MLTTKINFVCPKCSTVNRVADARIKDKPICAKCKTGLTSCNHPIELNDASFTKFVSRSDPLVIVDFWAEWCGPCRMMAIEFANAATKLGPRVLLAKLNTGKAKLVSQRFQVSAIPCLIAFRGGREIARRAGMMQAHKIVEWVGSL